MSAIVVARLRRASDQQILAERTAPPFTPLTWPGGALQPATDVYAEVVDTGGATHRTANHHVDAARRRAIQGGQLLVGDLARGTTARYVDAAGVERTAAAGAARDAHYISGERTLLLEPLRANLHKHSETVTQWSVSAQMQLASGHDSPLGTATAGRVERTGTGTSQYVRAYGTASVAGSHVVGRLWVRGGSLASYALGIRDTTAAAWIPARTRVLRGPGAGSATPADRPTVSGLSGSQWSLIEIASADPATADVQLYAYPGGVAGGAAGDYSYLTGWQVEAGREASSYVRTAEVQVERAADALTLQLPAGALYLRWLDPWTGVVSDSVSEQAGGLYVVPVGSDGRAYTHLVVGEPGRTLAQMRRVAGVG